MRFFKSFFAVCVLVVMLVFILGKRYAKADEITNEGQKQMTLWEKIPEGQSYAELTESTTFVELVSSEIQPIIQLDAVSEQTIQENVISEEVIQENVEITEQIDDVVAEIEPEIQPVYINELEKKVKESNLEPEKVTMIATAYCACIKCCGKTDGITASGAQATPWHTIAAPSNYPFGTILYIPAMKDKPNGGWFEIQDRGGAIKNNRIDVYYASHSEALNSGLGNISMEVEVYRVK